MTTTSVPADVQQQLQDNDAKKKLYEQAIQKVEAHLTAAPDHTLVLGIKSGADVQIDQTIFDALAKSLEQTNAHLKAGRLNPHQVLLKTDFGKRPASISFSVAGNCAGQSGIYYHWWGVSVYSNECQTQTVEGLLAAAAGAAAIADALGLAVLDFGLLAGILSLAVGALQFVDGLGGDQGLIFYHTWADVSWFWHQ